MNRPSRLGSWSIARSSLLAVAAVLTLLAAGCGYSEEEMRARLREIESLSQQRNAEAERNKALQRELDDARATVEQLKTQLKDAGINISNLSKSVEEQAQALEQYKKRAAQLEAIKQRFEQLRNKLKELMKLGLKVVVRKNRMVIQLPGDVLFDSGRASLSPRGTEILADVAEVIRNDSALMKRHFQVAGHTDKRPYGAGAFKDNWGLSVMRAREVLAFLVKPLEKNGGGLDAAHWSAAGYGSTDPVDMADTDDAFRANRRCELVVLPDMEEMLDLKALTEDGSK